MQLVRQAEPHMQQREEIVHGTVRASRMSVLVAVLGLKELDAH
jgi:hypothetical protein